MVTKANEILTSWINIPPDSDFSIYNIPFGVFKKDGSDARCCTAIGDYVVDLVVLCENHFFDGLEIPANIFEQSSLNSFIALGKEITNQVRERLIQLFASDNNELQENKVLHHHLFHRREDVSMLLPVTVGDYTDFYSSKEHATNVGAMFRDPANALLPNWKHLPVAYHGRASSIVVSGTPVLRPQGQFKRNKDDLAPVFGPTEALDFELEIAFVVGKDSQLGEPIEVNDAKDYIFGFLLFNDWSARDIQSWEYVPLGPFLAKNFLSSVSPWIVTLEALSPYAVSSPTRDISLLPYLQHHEDMNFDVELEVHLQPENGLSEVISHPNFRHMYWNVCQQLAHHTINGCNVRVGDLMASGTISGPKRGSEGSLLELTRNGKEPISLKDGSTRKFLNDGDTVTMKGFASKDGKRVGFGEVVGSVTRRQ